MSCENANNVVCTNAHTSGYHRLSHSSGAQLPSADLRDQLLATLSGSFTIDRKPGDGWMARLLHDAVRGGKSLRVRLEQMRSRRALRRLRR